MAANWQLVAVKQYEEMNRSRVASMVGAFSPDKVLFIVAGNVSSVVSPKYGDETVSGTISLGKIGRNHARY